MEKRRTWKCYGGHDHNTFTLKTGTIFEDSPLPLSKWLSAIWMLANAKNGTSSYEIARAIGVTQKSAWFMEHRIRVAMKSKSFAKMSGIVEADETFIGGLAKNMHKHIRARKITGTGGHNKAMVVGVLERGGKVHAEVATSRKKPTLQGIVKPNVETGARLFTDALKSYEGLAPEYVHEIVDHAVEYVTGQVHTNGLENFWCLLKRMIKGTYIHMDPVHLGRYLDEEVFRFNERDGFDADRFFTVLGSVVGQRLTYKQLIGKE